MDTWIRGLVDYSFAAMRDLGYIYNRIGGDVHAHNSWPKGCVHIAIHHRAYAVPFDQPLRGEVKKFRGLTVRQQLRFN